MSVKCFLKNTLTKKTTLNTLHFESSAKMIDFHGWNMPIHYGSQLKEHEFVRNSCGIFDVSHMTILDVEGKDAKELSYEKHQKYHRNF